MKKYIGWIFLALLLLSALSFAPSIVEGIQAAEIVVSNNATATPTKTRTRTVAPTKTRTPIAAPTKTRTPTVAPTKARTVIAAPTKTRTPTAAPTKTRTPTAAPARTLLFNDEFLGSAMDGTRWLPCYWWATTYCTSQPSNELELYRASNVLVGNGQLTLRGSKLSTPIEYCDRDCRRYGYASGMVQAGGGRWPDRPAGFTFTYGYMEVRAKLPSGRGLWPAIWLWPANYQDPPEIDLMENLGDSPNRVYMTYHQAGGASFQGTWTGPDLSQAFHTYALDWSPTALVWYIDGVERFRWTGTTPSQPMYPLLTLAVGGDWPGSPNGTTAFPADFVIDYLRIYKNSATR